MMNWDDYRIFLAVAREQSIRKASLKLGVSHSTVLRRITLFEEAMGVRLFERMPNGYFTTEAGDELLPSALAIENRTLTDLRKIAGRDTELSGTIRLTMPGFLASHLIMADLANFRKLYPGIDLEINTAYSHVDLNKREADVALRISNDVPEYLFGRKIIESTRAAYISENYLASCLKGASTKRDRFSRANWIAWSDSKSFMHWIEKNNLPKAPIGLVVNDPQATLDAVKAGMGMAILPCFVGDKEKTLYRVPPGTVQNYRSLWVLTHEDLRNTARIRIFLSFIADAILQYADSISGLKPRTIPKKFV